MSSHRNARTPSRRRSTVVSKGMPSSLLTNAKFSMPDMPSFFPDPAALDAEDRYLHLLRNSLFQREYECSTDALYEQLHALQEKARQEHHLQRERSEAVADGSAPCTREFMDSSGDLHVALPSALQTISGRESSAMSLRSPRREVASPFSPHKGHQHRPLTAPEDHAFSVVPGAFSPSIPDDSVKSTLTSRRGDPLCSDTEEYPVDWHPDMQPVPAFFSGPPPPVLATLADTIGYSMATRKTQAQAHSIAKARERGCGSNKQLSFTAAPQEYTAAVSVSPDRPAESALHVPGRIGRSALSEINSPAAVAPTLPRYVSTFPLADALVLEAEQRVAVELFCADICNDIVKAAAEMYVSRCFDSASVGYTAFCVWEEVRDSVLRSFVPIDAGEPHKEPSPLAFLSPKGTRDAKKKTKDVEDGVGGKSKGAKKRGAKEKNGTLIYQQSFGLLPAWSLTPSLLHAENILNFYDSRDKLVPLPGVSQPSRTDESRHGHGESLGATDNLADMDDAPPKAEDFSKNDFDKTVGDKTIPGNASTSPFVPLPEEPLPVFTLGSSAVDKAPAHLETFSYLLEAPPLRLTLTRPVSSFVDTDGDDPGAPPAPIPFDDHARYVVARFHPAPLPERVTTPHDENELMRRLVAKKRRMRKSSSTTSRRTEASVGSIGEAFGKDLAVRSTGDGSPTSGGASKKMRPTGSATGRRPMRRNRENVGRKIPPSASAMGNRRSTAAPAHLPPKDDQWTVAMRRFPRGYFTAQTSPALSKPNDRSDDSTQQDQQERPPQQEQQQQQQQPPTPSKTYPSQDILVVIDGEEVVTVSNTPYAPKRPKGLKGRMSRCSAGTGAHSRNESRSSYKNMRDFSSSNYAHSSTSAFEPVCIDDQQVQVQVNVSGGGATTFSTVRTEYASVNMTDPGAFSSPLPPSLPQPPARPTHKTYSILSQKKQKALEERQRRREEAAERAAYERQFFTPLLPPRPSPRSPRSSVADGGDPAGARAGARMRPEPGVAVECWEDAQATAGAERADAAKKRTRAAEARRGGGARAQEQTTRRGAQGSSAGNEGVFVADGGEWVSPPGRSRLDEFDGAIRTRDNTIGGGTNGGRNAHVSENDMASRIKSASSTQQRNVKEPVQRGVSPSRSASRVIFPQDGSSKHARGTKTSRSARGKKKERAKGSVSVAATPSQQTPAPAAVTEVATDFQPSSNTGSRRAFGVSSRAKKTLRLPRLPSVQLEVAPTERRPSDKSGLKAGGSTKVKEPAKPQSVIDQRNKVLDIASIIETVKR